jgi:hypothetical protein
MKRAFTIKSVLYAPAVLIVIAAFTSCVKEAGHYIATPVIKSGNLQFYIQGDTSHTLATPADTVSFTSYATPQTTISGQNGQKYSKCYLQFSANTKGTFNLSTLSLKYQQKSGTILTTTSTNMGTVTVDSINVNKGYIAGSFTGKVVVATADTANVVGTFTIQQ